MATLLWPGKEFKVSHLEMIKGMRVGGMGAALSCMLKSRGLSETILKLPMADHQTSTP